MDVNRLTDRLFRRERFLGQLPDESIIRLGRKHVLFLVRSLILPTALLPTSLGLLGAALYQLAFGDFDTLQRVILALGLALLPTSLLWMFIAYTEWENDHILLTTKRVVVMRKLMRFSEERREAELERIQDIRMRVSGVLGHLLRYGDLEIATSGAASIRMPRLAQVAEFKEAVFKETGAATQRLRERRKEAFKEKLQTQLGGWTPTGKDMSRDASAWQQ